MQAQAQAPKTVEENHRSADDEMIGSSTTGRSSRSSSSSSRLSADELEAVELTRSGKNVVAGATNAQHLRDSEDPWIKWKATSCPKSSPAPGSSTLDQNDCHVDLEEEVDEFLRKNEIDGRASAALRAEAPAIQRAVIDRGHMTNCRNVDATLMARLRVAVLEERAKSGQNVDAGATDDRHLLELEDQWTEVIHRARKLKQIRPLMIEEVDEFIRKNKVDERAAAALRAAAPAMQRAVIDRGDMFNCHNASSALIARLKDAQETLTTASSRIASPQEPESKWTCQAVVVEDKPAVVVKSKPGDWICQQCNDLQFANRICCRTCGMQNPRFKISLCRHFAAGHCEKGNVCSFAHGSGELRQRTLQNQSPVQIGGGDKWIGWRTVANADAGKHDLVHMKLAENIKQRQRQDEQFNTTWHSHCIAHMYATKDPALHSKEFLVSFCETHAPSLLKAERAERCSGAEKSSGATDSSRQVNSTETKEEEVEHVTDDGDMSELPAAVMNWLQHHRLQQYAKALLDAGYDDLDTLQSLCKDEVEEMLDIAGVSMPGHKVKFRRALQAIKAPLATSPVGS